MITCSKCGALSKFGQPCANCGYEEQHTEKKERLALLTVVAGEMEYKMLAELLENENIPSIMQHRGSGEYMEIYMGMSPYGVEVYVPEQLLEKAQMMIPSELAAPLAEEVSQEAAAEVEGYMADVSEQMYTQKKSIAKWILILMIFIVVIVLALFGLNK